MIPLHPQACPGHPDRLRWVVATGTVPFTGEAAAVPAPLAGLLDDGTLGAVRLEADAVVTDLGAGRSWPVEGTRVRTALHAALEQPAAWRPAASPDGNGATDGGTDGGTDALLEAAARELIDGEAGRFARSHGGSIDLVDVRDGVVRVRLGGACDGCPAARVTLYLRLDAELRARCPQLREVRALDAPARPSGLARFLPMPGRRGHSVSGFGVIHS